jgi:hypothetical protein
VDANLAKIVSMHAPKKNAKVTMSVKECLVVQQAVTTDVVQPKKSVKKIRIAQVVNVAKMDSVQKPVTISVSICKMDHDAELAATSMAMVQSVPRACLVRSCCHNPAQVPNAKVAANVAKTTASAREIKDDVVRMATVHPVKKASSAVTSTRWTHSTSSASKCHPPSVYLAARHARKVASK